MLRTIICCLLSVVAILIGGCGAGQGGDVPTPTAAASTPPLVVSVLHTPTPAAQQPQSPIVAPVASTVPHLASYIGPNVYRQSYPDFIVYYDPALWTFVRNPDGAGPTLESTQVLSCMVLLSMGAMETANVRYKQAGPYRWQISDTINPRGFLYSTLASDDLSLFFGLRVPDIEESVRNQKCTQLAENVMGTAAFVSASASTPQPTEQTPSKYYPPVSDRPDETPVPLTPEPYTPPTPYPEAAEFSDPDGIITVTLPKGWYGTLPPIGILHSPAYFANYDRNSNGRPDNGIYVQYGIEELEAGQTFEQWLPGRLKLDTQPDYGPGAEFVTKLQPIRLAGYSGVTYTIGATDEVMPGTDTVQLIYLSVTKRWVMIIIIRPITSPDYETALAALETLKISDIQ